MEKIWIYRINKKLKEKKEKEKRKRWGLKRRKILRSWNDKFEKENPKGEEGKVGGEGWRVQGARDTLPPWASDIFVCEPLQFDRSAIVYRAYTIHSTVNEPLQPRKMRYLIKQGNFKIMFLC